MKKNWCGVELPKEKADKLQGYLRENNILFEPSECYNLIHIECFMDENQLEATNVWIKNNLI